MAYRRPGVTVTQVFVGLAPALAALSLPSVSVGPAYQLVNDDSLGAYAGFEYTYDYVTKQGGAIVDLEELADDELFPVTKKPIEVELQNAIVEVLAEQTETGFLSGSTLSDLTASVFEDVAEGDIIEVIATTGVEVVSAQVNGVSLLATATRLSEGVAGDFDNVKVGDVVTVSGDSGSGFAIPGTYNVLAVLGGGVLLLDGAVVTADATDINFSIAGERGNNQEAQYTVATVIDSNNVTLTSPFAEDENLVNYRIIRNVDDFALERGTDYTADADGITLEAGITDGNGFDVDSADVYASYRALRTDLSAEVKEYGEITDIEAVFGVGQITPQNPLAYALSLMKQNTVTPVNGLAVPAEYDTDETLAFTKAADVLVETEMYAIAPLSFLPTVHTMLKNHVEQLSAPAKKRERVVIINSELVTTLTLQDESDVADALLGARPIISTKVNGEHDGVTLTTLTLTGAFANSQPGDSVVIESGDDVTPGNYLIASVDSDDEVTLDSAFATLGGGATNVQFYSVRQDGFESDGKTFYDRNAEFLSDGIAAGHYLNLWDAVEEVYTRYAIGEIVNNKTLVLATAIPGIASVQSGDTYFIDRDLSKSEQALNVKGYGEAFGSRRVVHTWPDILKAPVGQVVEDLPGYYAGPVVAALTTGLPTQQGFTELSMSGFLGLDHSSKYFTEDQLNVIAEGGNFILAQDGPNQPLYCRHQLTTDRSAIKFQEYSVTKNVDFIAKFLRVTFKPFIGQYNIVDTTLDSLSATAQGAVNFLKSQPLPKIGSVIRGGSLSQLEESEDQIDTIIMRFSFLIPIPLNYIDITIEV